MDGTEGAVTEGHEETSTHAQYCHVYRLLYERIIPRVHAIPGAQGVRPVVVRF